MNKNEQYAYGKIVDDLTVEQLIEYDNNNVHILLVRNKVSDEVRDAAKRRPVHIYDGLDDEKIQQVLSMLKNMKGDTTNET